MPTPVPCVTCPARGYPADSTIACPGGAPGSIRSHAACHGSCLSGFCDLPGLHYTVHTTFWGGTTAIVIVVAYVIMYTLAPIVLHAVQASKKIVNQGGHVGCPEEIYAEFDDYGIKARCTSQMMSHLFSTSNMGI